jgi:hypothetical protein
MNISVSSKYTRKFPNVKDCHINFQDGKGLWWNKMEQDGTKWNVPPTGWGKIVLINDPPNTLANKFVLGLYE